MKQTDIPMELVVAADDSFRISRRLSDSQLALSIKRSGIIRPPHVLFRKGHYIPVTGHNRIAAAVELGFREIAAFVHQDDAGKALADEALLKSYHREIGPSGKIKVVSLLRDVFGYDAETLLRLGRDGLAMPEWAVTDDSFLASFGELDAAVKDYLDVRDVPFRFIRSYLSLSASVRHELWRLSGDLLLRMNVFRRIVDMLSDISRRDGDCRFLDSLSVPAEMIGREAEEYLLDRIFERRYPEYSSMRRSAMERISVINSRGIQVDFPEYFEGGELTLKIAVRKRDNPALVLEKVKGLKEGELLDILKTL
jgi:ParB-like chromosome segregation protein Spo0J